MKKQNKDAIEDEIHMLGCQALTVARNTGFAEAKGEKTDDTYLLNLIEETEERLRQAIEKRLLEEREAVIERVRACKNHPNLSPKNKRDWNAAIDYAANYALLTDKGEQE